MRTVSHRYIDPLDGIWLTAARNMGLRVVRGAASYASYDGHGTLSLSDPAGMDPDDCLAQMILHEVCHALVQGPASFGWVDWGLDNASDRDRDREHACLRLQAALLAPFGLRQTLAPTTDFRAFYDDLPPDPFQERSVSERGSIVLSRAAFARRSRRPVGAHLQTALLRTAGLLSLLREGGPPPSDDCLLATAETPGPRHRSGLPQSFAPHGTCGGCAWARRSDWGTLRCAQSEQREVFAEDASCDHFEVPFDCLSCGACCREAYDTVEVERDDRAALFHLPLLIERNGGYDMARDGSRCICLRGGTQLTPVRPALDGGAEATDAGEKVAPLNLPSEVPFTCSIYATRPRTCREFSIFSDHCLSARRTVGLSR